MMNSFLFFATVGFGAQLIDGAIGMAFGVISTSVLLSLGIPPAVASATVNTAEIVTTGLSGLSHTFFKNVDFTLFKRLMIPGIIGSILGAFVLTKIPIQIAKPIISTYLLTMGLVICYKAIKRENYFQIVKTFITKNILKHKLPSEHAVGITPLGFAGGFLNAAGGGGWGSIVTSSLLAQGTTPHYTIGSVNLAEFMVAVSTSATFFFTINITHWDIILGLIFGGSFAAPLGAYAARRLHPKMIMIFAGITVITLSIRTLILSFIR